MRTAQAKSVFTVDFGSPETTPRQQHRGRIPRVARMLALAHKIDGMVRCGEYRDYACAARRLGLTRARVTQITNLLLLGPSIQEAILDLPPLTTGRDPVSERQLRSVVAEVEWDKQLDMWNEVTYERTAVFPDTNGQDVLRAHATRDRDAAGADERATSATGRRVGTEGRS